MNLFSINWISNFKLLHKCVRFIWQAYCLPIYSRRALAIPSTPTTTRMSMSMRKSFMRGMKSTRNTMNMNMRGTSDEEAGHDHAKAGEVVFHDERAKAIGLLVQK